MSLKSGNHIKFWTVFVAIIPLMSIPVSIGAEEAALIKTVEVVGASFIYGDNVATARDRAISNGLSSALEMVAADHLPLESLVQNFQVLNQTIYGQSGKYIQDYKVLAEARSDNFYRVMVQATISVDEILRQLSAEGLMLGKKAMPRILFFIVEKNIGEVLPQYWRGEDMAFNKSTAEGVIAGVMGEKGFLIIDPGRMVEELKSVFLNCSPDFDNKEVAGIGKRLGVDVVIVGKSIADIVPNTMGEEMKSFSGTISVRAIRTDTEDIVASTTQKTVTANSDEVLGTKDALSGAGFLAGEVLSSQIIAEWQRDVPSLSKVEIVVSGTRNLPEFVKFRSMLRDIPGVNEILIREMKPNETVLIVDFQGDAKSLAKALLLKAFDTFGINISEVSADRLKVELIPG